jgi:nucleoside-diphosphate-sugar epimerase
MLTERRVLVTGGAGFIGSHLCERLLERGDEVLCVDNFYTGTRHNVQHLLTNPMFEMLRHDICFPLYVEVDEIYNLACPASAVHYQFDPVQTTKVSVHGAINMLGLAKRVKAKILQASTSEVYGDPMVHPQKEDYWGNVNPIGVRSCYDEGKRCAETHRAKAVINGNTIFPGQHFRSRRRTVLAFVHSISPRRIDGRDQIRGRGAVLAHSTSARWHRRCRGRNSHLIDQPARTEAPWSRLRPASYVH